MQMFICGVCSDHHPLDQDSGDIMYIGLYGTAWQVCIKCKEKVD